MVRNILGVMLLGTLCATSFTARAERPHRDKVNGSYYRFHEANPRKVGTPYPGRYRTSALRYHYDRTTLFHGGPYYHAYHGPAFGHLNRPYHLGYGPPRPKHKIYNFDE